MLVALHLDTDEFTGRPSRRSPGTWPTWIRKHQDTIHGPRARDLRGPRRLPKNPHHARKNHHIPLRQTHQRRNNHQRAGPTRPPGDRRHPHPSQPNQTRKRHGKRQKHRRPAHTPKPHTPRTTRGTKHSIRTRTVPRSSSQVERT